MTRALLEEVRADIADPNVWTARKVNNDGKMSALASLLLRADWSLEGPGPTASMNGFANALGFEDWVKFAEWEREDGRTHAEVLARLASAIEKEG